MRWLVIVLCMIVASRDASAHQTSLKYVDIHEDAGELTVTVKLSPADVTEPLGLPPDAVPPLASILAHPAVPRFVQRWFTIGACVPGQPHAMLVDAHFFAVTWKATCSTRGELALDFTPFFVLDKRHEAIVRYLARGKPSVQTIVRSDMPRLTLRAGETPSLLAWIRTGMDHIYTGVDHMLFVVALLLVVMLSREGGRWQLRGYVRTLRSTAVVITAFTIAHSITLIAAALGVVTLPSQFVETLIALSIAYTAAEDVANPAVRWRFGLTFGFGLVHGLGFAASLANVLPPTDVVVPLLCFNVGVELGQLSVVLAVLPVLYLLARVVGAERYRGIALPALAAPIFLLGIVMVIERVLGLQLLPM